MTSRDAGNIARPVWAGWLQAPLKFAIALALACLAGCSSYPDPQPGYGQILVEFFGEPKQGAGGPTMVKVRGEYSAHFESIEQGKAFERVDYGAIDDVVTVLFPVAPTTLGPVNNFPVPQLDVVESGFGKVQIASQGFPGNPGYRSSIVVHNHRSSPVTIFGFSENNIGFEVRIEAGERAPIIVNESGVFDMFCLEDESMHCRWIVELDGKVWQGQSDSGAFFDMLLPGTYDLRVYPPRLPVRSMRTEVVTGERTELRVELTVNDLPKAK